MSGLICNMSDCVHRSKYPSRKWCGKGDGSKRYGCKLDCVVVSRTFDFDGDIEAVAGRENMAHCAFYERAPEEGEQL